MKDENFIQIAGWMINKLHLSGNDLVVYALLYGFSQDGRSEFCGTLEYIAEWLQISDRTALRIINKLVDDGLVTKRAVSVNGCRSYNYRAIG